MAETMQTSAVFRKAMSGKPGLNPPKPEMLKQFEETLEHLSGCPGATVEELRQIAADVRRVAALN